MGLRVNTNIASMTAQRNLFTVSSRLQGNFARLSSGLRIANASDDAAGLGISEKMRSQIRSFGVAARNAQDGISMAQTAEGSLNEVSNLLGRMRELAMQSANGTLDATDRATIQVEFLALNDEIERIAQQTQFNGIDLLNNTTGADIQVGIDAGQIISLSTVDATTAASGLDTAGLFTDTVVNANLALTGLDAAIDTVNTARGQIGSDQNRLGSALSSILNVRENLAAAESRIRDVDVASETADLTRNSIMQQAAVSILGQANVQPQLALSLLGG
jgi:flagellin